MGGFPEEVTTHLILTVWTQALVKCPERDVQEAGPCSWKFRDGI